jgi:hypothetical protein
MIVVALVGVLLGAIGPGMKWHRRWRYHRSEAAMFGRLESTERVIYAREGRLAADREAVRRQLMTGVEFASRPSADQERIVDQAVEFHRQNAASSRAAMRSWAEKRKDSETAAFFAFDPFAPDVP